MKNIKYYLINYGCQMNLHDSEKIAGQLEASGLKEAATLGEADLVILNTCCVRKKAEEKVRGKIGEIKLLKENKPNLIIGIGGCMMQQEGYGELFLRQYPYVNFIFGTHTLDEVPQLVKKSLEKQRTIALKADRLDIPDLPGKRESHFRAWVSIIKGCQNFCSYCIVPYVRGKEVSRPLNDIIEEVTLLGKDGVKEIVLLGQNVNAYGKDQDPREFSNLLYELNNILGIQRIRYLTSHPRDFTFELVDTIKSLDKVCEHFHLPLQAGSNKTLKAMNRGYTQEHYLNLVEYIKTNIPHASITTDFIVGFPGESEEDFEETLKIAEKVRFDTAFIFRYSPRLGTPAANFLEQVPEKTKIQRLQKLMLVQQKISLEHNQQMVGKTVEVLCEGVSKSNNLMSMGRTRTNKPIIFPLQTSGELYQVKINETNAHTLFGDLDDLP